MNFCRFHGKKFPRSHFVRNGRKGVTCRLARKLSQQRYNATVKGRAKFARYTRTDKGAVRQTIYNMGQKGQARTIAHRMSDTARATKLIWDLRRTHGIP